MIRKKVGESFERNYPKFHTRATYNVYKYSICPDCHIFRAQKAFIDLGMVARSFFLPFVGFFLYLLLGRQLRKKHLFRWDGRKDIGIEQLINYQIEAIESNELELRTENIKNYNHLIYMNLKTNNAVLTQDNDVKIFVDGSDKFEALINDILHAKNHIHIQYYIFKLDNLGQRILNALIKKAKQGVKVRVLFDEMGSRGVRKRHF